MKNYFNFKLLLVAAFVVTIFSCSDDRDTDDLQTIQELNSFDSANAVGESSLIPDQYIVVLNGGLTEDNTSKSYVDARTNVLNVLESILSESKMSSIEPLKVYAKSIAGATLKLSETEADLLRNDKRVKYIEQDRIVQFALPCGKPNGGPCDEPGDPTDPVDDGGGDGSSTQETPWGILRVNGVSSYTGTNVA